MNVRKCCDVEESCDSPHYVAGVCCLVVKKERKSTLNVGREIVLYDVAEEAISDFLREV